MSCGMLRRLRMGLNKTKIRWCVKDWRLKGFDGANKDFIKTSNR